MDIRIFIRCDILTEKIDSYLYKYCRDKRRYANIRRRSEAKHCSSLCSQSEGDEYYGGQARAENPTKLCPRALTMFATCSWPSLCEQSELQCWRRNRRLCGPALISTARALPMSPFGPAFNLWLPKEKPAHRCGHRVLCRACKGRSRCPESF